MQQFNPFQSFQQFDDVDMIEGEQVVEDWSVPQADSTSPPIVISGQIPVITAEQMALISGITSQETDSLSLADALRSTMSANTTGRIVVIPGSRKRKKATQEKHASTRRMSPRLRHTLIIIAILLVAIITLISLSPLSNGQIRFPVFSLLGNWVHANQLGWQVQAHDTIAAAPVKNTNPAPPPMTLPKSQYVAIAQQDAAAAGISPDYFVRQINAESGFNPNAVSSAGAVGIAQFLPSTAAGLGINPWDPVQALRGAAQLMASYNKTYGGNYAKALAAYNGGSGTVQSAVNNCGASWMNCLPYQTRHYIYLIMGI
jgi:hypothetical protein